MDIVIERLVEKMDGTIVTMTKRIPYSTAARVCGNRTGSTLQIYATVFLGCDRSQILGDGRKVWLSSFDSTNVYLAATV